MAILVNKCISCCTNIVQKIALHVAKKLQATVGELEKVKTYYMWILIPRPPIKY